MSHRLFLVIEYIAEHYPVIDMYRLYAILYYCKAWHLAWRQGLLFLENIVVKGDAIVIKELEEIFRDIYGIYDIEVDLNPFLDKYFVDSEYLKELNPYEKNTIDVIIEDLKYISTGKILENIRNEDPYINANERVDKIIMDQDMKNYYSYLG
jgi:replication initiation and membrane attachment protein DnaB